MISLEIVFFLYLHVEDVLIHGVDILHSYMALAALSIMGEPGLKPIDPMLCTSLTTRKRLEKAPWRKLEGRQV